MPAIYLISIATIIACISAFIILFAGKIGMRDEIIAKSPKLISQLFDCDFCLSFWTSFILAIILAIFFNEIRLLFIPIISTPITRILI